MRLDEHLKFTILEKLESDLRYGVRFLGNLKVQSDVIRVWTQSGDITFAINANNPSGSKQGVRMIEIQLFDKEGGIRLRIFLREGITQRTTEKDIEIVFTKLSTTFYNHGEEVTKEKQQYFFDKYLSSQPSVQLTKIMLERNAYEKDKYSYVTPKLYKSN